MHDKDPDHWYLLYINLDAYKWEVWDTYPSSNRKKQDGRIKNAFHVVSDRAVNFKAGCSTNVWCLA